MSRAERSVRPARRVEAKTHTSAPRTSRHVLIVDLNNFANFPTLAVGLLTSALRDRGHRVELLCPLAYDVPAAEREWRETWLDHLKRRIHLTDWTPALSVRDVLRKAYRRRISRPNQLVLREVDRVLAAGPDAVLLSAYLQHHEAVFEIGQRAAARGVPLLLGGPMFNLNEVAQHWRGIPGLKAVVGAEVDRDLPDIVETLCSGGDLLVHRGVVLPDGRASGPAAPLRNLDAVPMPDFTDFPWDRYPVRIVPIMTGRGCQWDKCLFCSDVISTSGRTFRTRSVENVLLEMQEQARRHETTNFLFLDLKLNSWPGMMRGIGQNIGRYVQGAEWVGTVHVDQRRDNGLSRTDLQTAVDGGMRRISFGLETGSQALLDAMRKGSSVERNAQFIHDAHAAGLSVRCTMFKGFPSESAADMTATADFLERHAPFLDRVRFNDFTISMGTPIWRAVQEKSLKEGPIVLGHSDSQTARANYRYRVAKDSAYRRAKARALAVVHDINRQALRDAARQFDGLM